MQQSKENIFFLSDSERTIDLYRKQLINKMKIKGHETFKIALKSILKIFFLNHKTSLIISSNIRANLSVCLLSSHKKIVIVNGIGRNWRSIFYRSVLIKVFNFSSPNSHFVFQSYRDYRFFRRYLINKKLTWIPGSGGEIRETSKRLDISR